MKTKPLTLSFLLTALLIGAGAPAMAQHANTPGIDRMQQEIHTRIQQGIASGHITQQEAQVLSQRERELRFREVRMKRDGDASPQEREQLRRDLEDMRNEVERKMNNPRMSGRHTPGIDNLEERVSRRIDQGVRSGRITQREARQLQRRERDLAQLEQRLRADGRLTPGERHKVREQWRVLENDVERMMENARYNNNGGRYPG